MFFSRLRIRFLAIATATAVLLTTSICSAQPLNLPTTEDMIGGFVQGGLQAAEFVSSVRGHRLGTGIRRPLAVGRRGRFGRRTVTYATPSQTVATQTLGNTTVPNNPLPEYNVGPEVVSAAGPSVWPTGIHVVNPAKHGVPIKFVVDGKPYTLTPGQRLEFAEGAAGNIKFDRGGNYGTGFYGLEAAVFTFTPTARGWELVRAPHRQPALTNSTPALQLPPPIPWPGG